jgi:molybdenum cofactor biosynthesis enzyme MoaA
MRNDNLVDVLPLLKENAATDALIKAFEEAVARRAPYWRY